MEGMDIDANWANLDPNHTGIEIETIFLKYGFWFIIDFFIRNAILLRRTIRFRNQLGLEDKYLMSHLATKS